MELVEGKETRLSTILLPCAKASEVCKQVHNLTYLNTCEPHEIHLKLYDARNSSLLFGEVKPIAPFRNYSSSNQVPFLTLSKLEDTKYIHWKDPQCLSPTLSENDMWSLEIRNQDGVPYNVTFLIPYSYSRQLASDIETNCFRVQKGFLGSCNNSSQDGLLTPKKVPLDLEACSTYIVRATPVLSDKTSLHSFARDVATIQTGALDVSKLLHAT